LLFARESTLVAQPFSATNFSLSGVPIPIAQDANVTGLSTGPTGAVQVSVSNSGALAYQTGGQQQEQLVWFDRAGKPLGNLGPPGITNSPQISPDGKRVVVDGSKDIWLYDTARGNAARFTINGAGDSFGVWSPDGARIVFCSVRNGKYDLYVKPAGAG